MPLPVRFNPSYSSTGINRKSVLCSATPQQKFSSNLNALSCNSKYTAMSERKHLPDTRPLADSSYHHSCINLILKFCSEHNYAIKKEALNFMSTSEMEKLFTFILSFYEIKIKQNSLDMEIPRVMETLCYPYHINKTSLRSYATPKSKGVVLSMIVFLIEPLMIERRSILNDDERDDCNLEILKMMLNRNPEEKDNYIKQKMNKQIIKKNELEGLIKKTEELKNESHSLDNQDDQLNKLRENVVFLENQLKDFKIYEKEMEEYVESSSKENDELKKKIELTDEEISNLNDLKLRLENEIRDSAHSVQEINYYILIDKEIQTEIKNIRKQKQETEDKYYEEKFKLNKLFTELKELFLKLTKIIGDFDTVLPRAQELHKCLDDKRYESLIAYIKNPEEIELTKLKSNLDLYTEFLKSIKQAINNDLIICKQEIIENSKELEHSSNRIKQLNEKHQLIKEQKEYLIHNLEQRKLDLINRIQDKKDQNKQIEEEINTIETNVKLRRKKAMNENLKYKNECEQKKKRVLRLLDIH